MWRVPRSRPLFIALYENKLDIECRHVDTTNWPAKWQLEFSQLIDTVMNFFTISRCNYQLWGRRSGQISPFSYPSYRIFACSLLTHDNYGRIQSYDAVLMQLPRNLWIMLTVFVLRTYALSTQTNFTSLSNPYTAGFCSEPMNCSVHKINDNNWHSPRKRELLYVQCLSEFVWTKFSRSCRRWFY